MDQVLVVLGTLAICVVLYEGIRRSSLTRLLFGMKASAKIRKDRDSYPPVAARLAAVADDKA